MRMGKLWMMAVGALAFAACGEGGSAQVGGGDENGGLRVNVLDMTEALVEEIHLTITADASVSDNHAVTQSDLVLTRATATVDQNAPATWKFLAEDIPVGDYKVQAFAYNVPNRTTEPATFTSVEVDVKVTSGGTTIANVFLRQSFADPNFNTPYITAVVFDTVPAFYEETQVTVLGTQGAAGALTLDARGVGLFNGVTAAVAPSWTAITGDARTGVGTASFDWTPKDPTNPGTAEGQEMTVRLTDTAGNDTGLRMTINVDHQRGDIDFNITFNEAPSIAVKTSIVNDAAASQVTMSATYTDLEHPTANVTYTWNVSDCERALVTILPAGSLISGTVAGDGIADHTVTLTWDLSAQTHPFSETCAVIVNVEDQGILVTAPSTWAPDSSSSRTQVINLTVGTVVPAP